MSGRAAACADSRALPVLAALLAGQAPTAIARDDAAFWEVVLHAGRFHGVLPLVHAAWPADALRQVAGGRFADGCVAETRRVAAMDLAQRQAIARVLPIIAAAGGDPVLLKGSALAWTHYAAPVLRPRADIDVFIAARARAAVAQALADAGLVAALQLPGEYVSSQATWTLASEGGLAQAFDVHWRVNNSPVLARLLDHAEIAAAAVPLPVLGPAARVPSTVHALLIAALHRVGSRDSPYHVAGWSQAGGDRLIWLMDFVMLARALDADTRARLHDLIRCKGAQALFDDAVTATQEALPAFASAVDVLKTTDAKPDPQFGAYIAASPARRRWLDFLAVGGWGERAAFVREQLLPPLSYLRARDPGHARWPRLFLAARRLARRTRG